MQVYVVERLDAAVPQVVGDVVVGVFVTGALAHEFIDREVQKDGHAGYYVSQHPLTFSNDYSDFEKAESWYENTYGC